MIKIYKYMSEKAALSFINQPLLRISPSHQLNDPFEFLPSRASQLDLKKRFPHDIKEFMDLHGVLCFSESPDNLLMWSHYAEHHKGAVVEFVLDRNAPFDLFAAGHVPKASDAKFDKVKYKRKRNYDGDVLGDSVKRIREHYAFIKSEDWKYEKEYRFVLPFTSISHELNENGEMTWFNTGLINAKSKQTWLEANNMFFVQVDPLKIGRIILGANANRELYIEEMKKKSGRGFHREFWQFNGKNNLHLKGVERAELDSEKFELTFTRLEQDLF